MLHPQSSHFVKFFKGSAALTLRVSPTVPVTLFVLLSSFLHSPTMRSIVSLLSFPASSLAGTVLWSGIFNSSATVEDFDDCTRLPVASYLEHSLIVWGLCPTKSNRGNGTSMAVARRPSIWASPPTTRTLPTPATHKGSELPS